MQSFARVSFAVGVLVLVSACPKEPEGGGGEPPNPKRCVVDLKETGLFAQGGEGASAKVITSPEQRIGGQTAMARDGDVLMQNDKVRFAIEQPGRTVGPTLYGGGVIDADLVRGAGEAGHDQFGRMELAYALGRVTRVTDVEILSDGSTGGPAVVAVSGDDVPHDLISLKLLATTMLGNIDFVVDPDVPVPARVTTYYVLSPGETRLRMMTAFCNDGDKALTLPLIDLYDFRGSVEYFNPDGCAQGLGAEGCLVDPSSWVGTQGDGVAYGLRSYRLGDLTKPVERNAAVGYGGVVGAFVEGESMSGLLSWTDPDARNRPGTFIIRKGEVRSYLRDFVVARDLAGVSAAWLDIDGTPTGSIEVSVSAPAGSPAGARVAAVDEAGQRLYTVLETDDAGKGTLRLPAGTWVLSAATEGRLVGPEVTVTLAAGETKAAALTLEPTRRLTVQVKDEAGAPMPAKVTVRCGAGECPFSADTWKRHVLLERLPGGAAAIAFVPVSGKLDVDLPPGRYEVLVSRGPEYSLWPDRYPLGEPVDLTDGDAQVEATLVHVVDTAGWQSADFHVHAVNSSDSAVSNEKRVANFLAEGVDVMVSTDHDFITDYAPVIRELGAEQFIASIIGDEATSFSHGHFNVINVTRDPSVPNGGAIDHAGGEGPTLRMTELFPAMKAKWPDAFVQLNHPRGGMGVLTLLRVDTATLASRGKPGDYLMAPAPDATASDTKLFGDGFDGLEIANGSSEEYDVINDWMTFLSRGTVRTATGASDTHKAFASTGGYARTWVKTGSDGPLDFSTNGFAAAARAHHALVGNGPFLTVKARRLGAGGQPEGDAVEPGGTLSVASGGTVEVVADVQAPEWVQFDRIEVYTHTTGREAIDGESNSSWPESRILAKQELDPAALTIEPVPGSASGRRVHETARFEVPVTGDTWLVVMVRSVNGTRTMTPLHGSKPFAVANAILIDGDGSGAYDDFPLKGQPLTVAGAPQAPRERHVPTAEEFEDALRRLLSHGEPR